MRLQSVVGLVQSAHIASNELDTSTQNARLAEQKHVDLARATVQLVETIQYVTAKTQVELHNINDTAMSIVRGLGAAHDEVQASWTSITSVSKLSIAVLRTSQNGIRAKYLICVMVEQNLFDSTLPSGSC